MSEAVGRAGQADRLRSSETSGPLLALYAEAEQAARAMGALRRAGFRHEQLEVLTGVPYPEGAFGEPPAKHRLAVYPFLGAAAGFALSAVGAAWTQLAYPLVTGGLPLLAIPPVINVLYEGTLLGALVATFAGVLLESRLPDFFPAPYDPRISEGYVGVLVNAGARRDTAEAALREAGPVEIIGAAPPAAPPATAESADSAAAPPAGV
jgi:hypothetical protein